MVLATQWIPWICRIERIRCQEPRLGTTLPTCAGAQDDVSSKQTLSNKIPLGEGGFLGRFRNPHSFKIVVFADGSGMEAVTSRIGRSRLWSAPRSARDEDTFSKARSITSRASTAPARVLMSTELTALSEFTPNTPAVMPAAATSLPARSNWESD